MRSWAQLQLQDRVTPTITILLSFHDLILTTMILILSIIFYILIFTISNKLSNRIFKEAHKIEFIWTVIPAIILLLLAIPSLRLLYLIEESTPPIITIKAIGHQWYWNYEYRDLKYINFNSFILNENSLNTGIFRLLEVDNRIIIPIQTEIRLLVTASDVIHSWTIPSIGIKIDAIPGRLNQSFIYINRPGVFYGQCSEICGANHSFIPIVIESVNVKSFINWSESIK